MAIDKSRSKLWVKVVIWITVLAFASSVIAAGISLTGLFGGGAPSGSQQQVNNFKAIDDSFKSGTQTLAKTAASNPTSYAAQVALANRYIDWVGSIESALQTQQQQTGKSNETTAIAEERYVLYSNAKDAYSKAIKIKKDDPQVLGDYSISLFYTNDTSGAIVAATRAVTIKPDFAVVWFNLGNFYLSSKQNAKAIAAYQQYLKLQPKGQLASAAQQNIKQAQSGSTGQ